MSKIIPYILLVGVYLVLRSLFTDAVFGEKEIGQPIFTRVFTMLAATLDYMRLLFIPYPLSPFYPARWYTSIFDLKVLLAVIVLSLICFLAYKIRKDRVMLFLLLSPFIMLFLVIWRANSFPIGNEQAYIAERFLYVPLMVFSLFISASVIRILDEEKKKYIITGWILTMVIFIIITMSANRMWRDDITVFSKIIEDSPQVAFAHNNLGSYYLSSNDFKNAVREFKTAIGLKPDYVEAINNLGFAYYDMGLLKEALILQKEALRLNPTFRNAHYGYALALEKSGDYYNARKSWEMVIRLSRYEDKWSKKAREHIEAIDKK